MWESLRCGVLSGWPGGERREGDRTGVGEDREDTEREDAGEAQR